MGFTGRAIASLLAVTLLMSCTMAASASYHGQAFSNCGPYVKYTVIKDRQNALGDHPVLMENPYACDPSFCELLDFLRTDDTVNNKYECPKFTCADFAMELQNHAESQGIRGGYASLKFYGKNEGHAVNVFDTTDNGLVYVDTTGGKTVVSRDLHTGDQYFNLGTISQVTNYW